MFSVYMGLPPAVVQRLEPPQWLVLWQDPLRRFLTWVWHRVAPRSLEGYPAGK